VGSVFESGDNSISANRTAVRLETAQLCNRLSHSCAVYGGKRCAFLVAPIDGFRLVAQRVVRFLIIEVVVFCQQSTKFSQYELSKLNGQ